MIFIIFMQTVNLRIYIPYNSEIIRKINTIITTFHN